MAKIKYSTIGADLRQAGAKDGALSVQDAKKLLGWTEEPKAGAWEEWTLKDLEGNKILLKNNLTNRPFRLSLAKRYANEILRKAWAFNGESLILDKFGMVQDGQHRLVGLILAEQMRAKEKERWAEYGWRGPVSMDALIVTGISDKPETVDTIGLGTKRSLGDVIFRRREFTNVDEKDAKRLANILSHAIRLCWIRSGGKTVSDAPHFPHSEALSFLDTHERLLDAVLYIWEQEGGQGAEGKRVSSFCSLGYAAGMLYLMATAQTDREAFDSGGAISWKLWSKAKDFWGLVASGEGLRKGNPVLALRALLPKIGAAGSAGRDEICSTIIKAWNLWADGKKGEIKEVKVKRKKDQETGKFILSETPRIGGLDIEIIQEEEVPAKEEKPPKKAQGWKAGDTAWVDDPEEEGCWFGTIEKLTKTTATLKAKDDGESYTVKLSTLSVDKPGEED